MADPQTLSHIVAMAENRVIGAGGTLPWRIPEDLQLFKRLTTGHALIMGRKTYESIGRPLPGRLNVVVTRQAGYLAQGAAQEAVQGGAGVVVCRSVAEARAVCAAQVDKWGPEVFVIGGGELYRETMSQVSTVYLTQIPRQVTGDTFYPELPAEMRLMREELSTGVVAFTWQVWERLRTPY